VIDGIFEEHQTHFLGGIFGVIVFEQLVASGLEFLETEDLFIDFFSKLLDDSFFVLDVFSEEVAEVKGVFFFEFLDHVGFVLSEGFETDIVDVSLDLIFIGIVGEFINKHSFAFVSPKRNQKDFRFHRNCFFGSKEGITFNL